MSILARSTLKPAFRSVPISWIWRFNHKPPPPPAKKDQKDESCPGNRPLLMQVSCKNAIISGGAQGIGLAVSHEILSAKAKTVALIGPDKCRGAAAVNELNCAYGKNRAIFFCCDIREKKQMEECYEKIMKELKTVNMLINAEVIFDGTRWEEELGFNFMGQVYNMLEAYKVLPRGSVILNISGLHGLEPLQAAPTFAASQHAAVGLSRSFGESKNVLTTGIRVVTLCPGITTTNVIKEAKALNCELDKDLEEFLSKVKRQNVEACGKYALHALKYGKSGSVWVVSGSKLYYMKIPSWKKYRILESQLV